MPDADAVHEVIAGPRGTLTALRPGTVHIEMSTIPGEAERKLRDEVRAAGGDLLDCPISGSPAMVAPRMATTFASGDPDSVEAVRRVLDAISGRWVHSGAFGAGASMKYVAIMLLATHMAAAAEAMLLARGPGLDLDLVQRTWSSWISYASAIVRSSYFSVSGSTGWRLVYAPSNIPAISSRDCSITSAPFTGPVVQALPSGLPLTLGPLPKLYAV